MEIVFLLLGWLLGLLSPITSDRILRRYRSRELQKTLLIELRELRHKMAGIVYRVRGHFAEIDRALLSWLKPIVDDYAGPWEEEGVKRAVAQMSELDHTALGALNAAARGAARHVPYFELKRFSLPFMAANIDLIPLLKPPVQQQVLEIKAGLDIFNEDADFAWHHATKTFDSSITGEDRKRPIANLEQCYRRECQRAREIVDQIGRLIDVCET